MKNLFLTLVFLFSVSLIYAGPEYPPTDEDKEEYQLTTLRGKNPIYHPNGSVSCEGNKGVCATIEIVAEHRIQVAVQNATQTIFEADLEYEEVVEEETSFYNFSNVELIRE